MTLAHDTFAPGKTLLSIVPGLELHDRQARNALEIARIARQHW